MRLSQILFGTCTLAIAVLASQVQAEQVGFYTDAVYTGARSAPMQGYELLGQELLFRGQSCSCGADYCDGGCGGGGGCDGGCSTCGSDVSCDSCGACDGCCGCGGGWLNCTQLFIGADAWASRVDDDEANNFGLRAGFNTSFDLGSSGLQGQFGASYGSYDWSGHENGNTTDNESQVFITLGIFRRADPCCGSRVTFGLVWDYMQDKNLGASHIDTVSLQLARWRLGYALDQANEIGLWGTSQIQDSKNFQTTAGGTVLINGQNQINAYWEHYTCNGSRFMAYLGWLEEPGEFVIGVNGEVPISDRLSMYGVWSYGKPSTSAGDVAPNGVNNSYSEAYWNVGVGFVFYWGGRCGQSTPLMPVADNSTFMIQAPVGDL